MSRRGIRVTARRDRSGGDHRVDRYLRRCVSPLVGPIREIQSIHYDRSGPALYSLVPSLVDLHRRTGVPKPQYHLGGFGFSRDEAVMRALGESMERTANFLFHVDRADLLVFRSERELAEARHRHLPLSEFGRFSAEQLTRPQSLIQCIDTDTPISWLPTIDARDGADTLLPAQVLLAGFPAAQEPRGFVGMTTGGAAHISIDRALIGALLEMLQVDATVGHWYSGSTAPRIEVSQTSTPTFVRFWEQHTDRLDRHSDRCEFYWLRLPDNWPVYVVACALRRPDEFPAVTVGLGIAVDLERAMYRALYEAIPTSVVAMIQALEHLFEDKGRGTGVPQRRGSNLNEVFAKIDLDRILNLEAAVAYYALPEHAEKLFPARFDPTAVVTGPEIRRQISPEWRDLAPDVLAPRIVQAITERHRLFLMDLTTEQTASLGLHVARAYSPDLMALCLPSLPEVRHPRFDTYGGYRSAEPHPYP